VALADLKFCHLGKQLTEPSNYDKVPLCKILYFVWTSWECTKDQKMIAVHGRFMNHPTHIHSPHMSCILCDGM
jgi:hypothetical protein